MSGGSDRCSCTARRRWTPSTSPSELADGWLITKSYLRNTSSAIADWLSEKKHHGERAPTNTQLSSPEIADTQPPQVIHYDRLAALTTLDGARRLERAAIAVQRHVGAPRSTMLDNGQRRLLNMLANGTAIVEMADGLGYSEHTIYRTLDRLYSALSVTDRIQGVRKAATKRLLDD